MKSFSLIKALLFFVFVSLTAANLHSSCGIQTVEIRHINGIWTSEKKCGQNLKLLKERFGATSGDAQLVYAYSYNSVNGALDLYIQKAVEADADKARALALALLSATKEGVDQETLDQINADYESAIKAGIPTQKIADMTTAIASGVSNSISSGKPVVLVPHSQGCLYANSVFQQVTGDSRPSSKLKIVGIAETASSVFGDPAPNNSYVTANEDRAISILRTFFPGTVLSSNTASGITSWFDVTRHDFQELYLNPDYKAWPEVRKKLAASINALQPAGKVKFSATWDPATVLEFRMMLNGMDTSTSSPDPNIVASAGRATYCVDMPASGIPTTYTVKLVNRTSASQPVSISGPLGSTYGTISAQSGIFPGYAFGTTTLAQNSLFSTYPESYWFE